MRNILHDITKIEFNPIFLNQDGKILSSGSVKNDKSVLAIRARLTHAGKLNNNAKFYVPAKMSNSVKTLLHPYAKPILTNHDIRSEPLGRISNARYVDISSKYFQQLPNVLTQDVDINIDNINVIKDYVKTIKQNVKGQFEGLGYIEGILSITDANSKEKVFDERYLTISVTANSPDMYCAACGTNWMKESFCGHMPGATVKDSDFMNFAIPSTFEYQEVSFVRTPADEYAMVTGFGDVLDSTEIIKINVDPDKIQNLKTNLYMYINNHCYDLCEKDFQIKDTNDFILKSALLTGDKMTLIKTKDDVMKNFINVQDITDTVIDSISADSFEEKNLIIDAHNQLHHQYDYYEKSGLIKEFTPGKAKLHAKLHQELASAKLEDSIIIGNIDSTLSDYNITFNRYAKSSMDQDNNQMESLTDEVKTKLKAIFEKEEKDVSIEDSMDIYNAVKIFLPKTAKTLTKSAIQRAHSQTFIYPGRRLVIPAGDSAQDHYNATLTFLDNIKDIIDDNILKTIKTSADARALLLDLNIIVDKTIEDSEKKNDTPVTIDYKDMTSDQLKAAFTELSKAIQDHKDVDYDSLIGEARSVEMSKLIQDIATYKTTIQNLENNIFNNNTIIKSLRDEMNELNAVHLTICDEYEALQAKVTPIIAKFKGLTDVFNGNLEIKDFDTKIAEFEAVNFNELVKNIDSLDVNIGKFSINDGLVRITTGKVQNPTLDIEDEVSNKDEVKLNINVAKQAVQDAIYASLATSIPGLGAEQAAIAKSEIVIRDYINRGLLPKGVQYSDLIKLLGENS